MFASSRKSKLIGFVMAAAVAAGAGGGGHTAMADATTKAGNSIAAVDQTSAGAMTTIRIKGTQAAKFSVYRLERPTRIVIDIAGADLSTALSGDHETSAVMATNSWAVSQVAASALEDGGKVVRVVVSLARPGRYDVKAAGNDIIVTVTARDAAPVAASAADVSSARAEADVAKRERAGAIKAAAAAELAKRDAEATATAAKATAATAAGEAERLRKQAAIDADRAAKAEKAAAAATTASDAERKRLAAELTTARADAAKATEAARLAQLEAERAKRTQTEAEAEARAQISAAAAAAEADRKAAAAERAAAARMMQEATAAKTDAAKATAAAADERAAATKMMAAASAASAAAEQAKRDADKRATAATTAIASAERERTAAAAAAKRATQARDGAATEADSAQRKALADAAAKAEARLKAAEASMAAAERSRVEADAAALAARTAAADAKRVADAEAQRRDDALAATARAVSARQVEETKLKAATAQRTEAEAAVAMARAEAERAADSQAARTAAERRAAELASSKAAAAVRAQADADAAVRQKASQQEIDRARAEAKRLTDEKRAAEAALTARRAEVAAGQADVDRLASARATAAAEVARLTAETEALRAARATEEQRLVAARTETRSAEATRTAEVARATEATRTAKAATAEAAAAKAAAAEATAAKLAATKAAAPTMAAPKATATPSKLMAITDVAFRGDAEHGDVTIVAAGELDAQLIASSDTRVEFSLDGVDLPASLERKLDVSRFDSPVRAVSSFRDQDRAGRVRLVIDLASPATPKVSRDGGTLRVTFAAGARRPVQDLPAPVMGGYGASTMSVAQTAVAQVSTGRRKVFRGRLVNLDFKEAPIHDLLRFLAQWANVNIVVPDDIDASVTVKLRGVPWDQALEVILASKQLWYRKEGNLYRIATRKEIDDEDQAEAARREALRGSEEPEPEILTLNYASASELKPKFESMLSAKGKLEIDERTNALIISDIADVRRKIKALSLALDTQTPQISIEARIVEARSTFQRQFGIQWGGSALASAAGGNATGLLFPSSVGVSGGADDTNLPSTGVATPSNFLVNLPSTLAGAAMGMSLGSVGGNFNINLRLSAMEENGTVRIISAPKITVLNNSKATISQGVSIPISVVGAAGTQTQFIPADLSLSVTPYVSQRDCSIAMDVQVSKNEPDFVNTGARGDPTILKKEASTKMLVADGETAVLGGIYTRNSGLSYSKVPFLGDLPVLGWLFKQRAENDERTEVLVFITPKITNKAYLRCE